MSFWPISRSPSVTTSLLGDAHTPVSHYGAVPRGSDVSVALLRPSHGAQTLSFRRWHTAPKPTRAAQLVAAAPHQALDHAFERGTRALGRKALEVTLKPPIVDHDACLLALLLTTCAAVGGANLVHEISGAWRDRWLAEPMGRGIDALDGRLGPWASVPSAVALDGACLVLALMFYGAACLTGVTVGIAAAVSAAPFVLGMPAQLRKTLADGLRAYLTLQKRLAAVDKLLGQKHFAPPHRLSAALEGLQRHINTLTHVGPPHEEAPQTHMHFHYIKDLLAEHPNAARRLGLPRLLGQERLRPIKERLVRQATQRRRSEELVAAGRSHPFLFGAAS